MNDAADPNGSVKRNSFGDPRLSREGHHRPGWSRQTLPKTPPLRREQTFPEKSAVMPS